MRSSVVSALLAAVVLVAAPGVLASDYVASPVVVASPAVSPLPDPCPFQGETATETNYANTEVEPLVAVNPTNPDNDRRLPGGPLV
jgi:hypothetical protein